MASHLVDGANTLDTPLSLVVLSGATVGIGNICDMMHADTYTNLWVASTFSGILPIFIQTSPSTASGDFTDPTSGLPTTAFPVANRVVSGGIFYANSGLYTSGNRSPFAPINNAPQFCSGGIALAAFQRPNRYARLIFSGAATPQDSFYAGFIGQKRVTGSGGGTSLLPGSGTVSV